MRGRGVIFGAVLAAATAVVVAAEPAAAASSGAVVRVAQSNAVSFTLPGGAVQGSAAVYTRDAAPLTVTVSAVPGGRGAALSVRVANTSAAPVRLPRGGLRVTVAATRDGRRAGTWVLRSPSTRSLAPGQTLTLNRSLTLRRAGTYEVWGSVRYRA